MKLSIVSTLYCSAPYVAQFCQRACASAEIFAGSDYEIVLVNDGSPDDSLERAIALSRTNRHIVVVDLSRNFGHHRAMMTGLEHAAGDRIFLIDSDLEEKPEWLMDFADRMAVEESDAVYGVQRSRKGGIFERWSGTLFYNIFRGLSGLDLPANIVNARLMTRRYVRALLRHQEREIFVAGLWVITGFRQSAIVVDKLARGESSYSLRRRISLFVNSITSFSNKPLIAIFASGCIISLLAFLFTAYLVAQRFLFNDPPEGWTSVIASVWLLGGFIMASIGIIGVYLAKVFSETKQRPYTIIRDVYRDGSATETVE